jgi:hypothetical protein
MCLYNTIKIQSCIQQLYKKHIKFYFQSSIITAQILSLIVPKYINGQELGMVVHTYNSSIQEAKIGGSQVPGQPGRCSEPLIQKTKEKKNAMF